MASSINRRQFASRLALSAAAIPLLRANPLAAEGFTEGEIAPFRTPYKYGKLVLSASTDSAAFDSKSVDDPFVFLHEGAFHMLYIGFDGTGYQTGLAKSPDLVHWERVACVAQRDPNSKYTQFNIALACLLREDGLTSRGRLKKIHGRYLGAWNAYPNAGYEAGAAVIGLAWSDDLLHWELTEPILFPADGAPWEHGGLYRPNLVEQDGVFYLYYNAKTDTLPKAEGGGWHEQSGVATSRDLKTWTRYEGNPILRNGGPDSRDARFASNPFVVRDRNLWGMYYFGFDMHGKARELLALGRDPFHFAKVDEIMIDLGVPGSVDETFAHKPCVIFHDGALYHFYCAVSGKWPHEVRGISVARSLPW
jgi:Glycosyl hydrolases family 32 N-terminal domain